MAIENKKNYPMINKDYALLFYGRTDPAQSVRGHL